MGNAVDAVGVTEGTEGTVTRSLGALGDATTGAVEGAASTARNSRGTSGGRTVDGAKRAAAAGRGLSLGARSNGAYWVATTEKRGKSSRSGSSRAG